MSHAQQPGAGFRRFDGAAAEAERLAVEFRGLPDNHGHGQALAAFKRAASYLDVPPSVVQLVAARPTADLGWEVAVVRLGRLVAAGTIPRGARPGPYVDALVATAETVLPGPGPLPAATAEEVECVLRWLELPGTRLVRLEGTWASPAFGAGGRRAWLETAQDARAEVSPFEDRRGLRPAGRPGRS